MFGKWVEAATGEVIDEDAASEVGIHDGDGYDVADRGGEGLGDVFVRLAVMAEAGNLGDFEDLDVNIRVLAGVALEVPCDLLGGGHAGVREEAAIEGSGEVAVEEGAGKVSAVAVEHMEMGVVGSGIEASDEGVVLFRSGVKAEGIGTALVGDADEFGPAAVEEAAGREVRAEGKQVGLVIASAKAFNEGAVDACRDVREMFDGVEVGDQGDGDPVVATDALVTGDDGAEFAGLAAPEMRGRVSADAGEINGVVASGIEIAKEAVGFFHKESGLGVGAEGEGEQCRDGGCAQEGVQGQTREHGSGCG